MNPSEINVDELVTLLRRKEQTWVKWGEACSILQKAGYNPQRIFEETGFEPIQQNQVIVGFQVFNSLVAGGIAEKARSHYLVKGSDILYELRILTQNERVSCAQFIYDRNLDADQAKEIAKAVKDFSRYSSPPAGFSNHPGDAIAYQYWRFAKEKNDLQERARLIAKGLMFAHSSGARTAIEQLLSNLGQEEAARNPMLPFYRIESTEDLPRIIPIFIGFPQLSQWSNLPILEPLEPFKVIESSTNLNIVALPGWQIIRAAINPVGILINNKQLPVPIPEIDENVLVIIDRSNCEWEKNKYFLIEQNGNLNLQWFINNPQLSLLGQVILVLRPRRILDEDLTKDVWQIDE